MYLAATWQDLARSEVFRCRFRLAPVFCSPGRQPAYSICSMGAAKDVWQVITTYWSLLLGNTLEWYEFCLFSFLEPYFQETLEINALSCLKFNSKA